MPFLPVYDWLGLELSRRAEAVTSLALLVAGAVVAHVLGWVDLGGISASVLLSLSSVSRLVVFALAGLSVVAVATAIDERPSDYRAAVIATVGGFFLIDLFYIHPEVWSNVPALFYWLAKPVWVGVPMFGVAWWLSRRVDWPAKWVLLVAGVAGVIVLQLYYTVVPIPVVGGDAIQIGLVGNLSGGVPVHGAGLIVALTLVLIGMKAMEGDRT